MPLSDTVLTCNSSPCSLRLRRALSIVMVIVGIVIPFIIIRYRVPGHDECFQALNVRDYSHSPMAMLTFYLGNVWCRLFGDTLLALRSLMALELQLSIAIGCGWFYRKTRDGFIASFLFLFMSLLSTHCTLFIYGWDLGAYLFITLTLLATLYYMERGSRLSVILVGASTALMALARIPTLAILPVLLGIIIWRTRKYPDSHSSQAAMIIRDSLLGLLAFGVTAIITVTLLFGFENYLSAWSLGNVVTGHLEIKGYIDRLLWFGPGAVRLWVLVAVLAVISIGFSRYFKARKSWFQKGLLAIVIILISIGSFIAIKFNAELVADFGFAQGLFIVLLLYVPVYNIFHAEKRPVDSAFLAVIILFSLLGVVGSDCIAERPLTITLIPFIAVVDYPYRKGALAWLLITLFIVTAIMNAYIFASLARNHKCHFSNSRVETIAINSERMDLFTDVRNVVDNLPPQMKKIAFWGKSRYFLDYVNSDAVPPLLQQYHYEETDSTLVGQVASVLQDYDAVIIHWNPLYDGNTYEPLANKLSKRGFRREIISDNFWVLKKSPE